MEALMVSAFSGAMGSLLAKLAALLEKDFKLAKGAKKEIGSLRDEMSSINAFLMKLSAMEEPIDVQYKELRSKVRELAYDMEDCVDIFMHSCGRDANKTGLLHEIQTVRARHKTGALIRDLKARVAAIGKWNELILHLPGWPHAVRVDPRIQALYADAASLQGIEGPKEKLVELLKEDGSHQLKLVSFFLRRSQLKLVSIVGFGGIGKTTLAKQVYTTIQGQYDCTAFVSVSRNPDLAKILSDIIKQVKWFHLSQDDENQLIERLRGHLQDKRYLIVIDDIWTIEVWNIIKCCFVENNRGSRVITTTRIEDIATACCSGSNGYVYRMKPLSDVDSRRLFHRRIFHSEDACPEQLKGISDEILKKCGGLPLAILTIGSILASHQEVGSTEIWEKIIYSFRFQLETSPSLEWMRHVFNLGYNDLPLDLKTCMLYLGIFPEDCKIHKDDLLRRWMAEGFVTEKHGYCQEEIAESYINELINRNMVQIAEFDDCGEVLSCRVHDLMLDFIILKSTEENFITIINDHHSTKGPLEVRRLSLQARNSEKNKVIENMVLTQARSFNLWGHAQWLPTLSKFRLLRVLHLDIYGSKDRKYDMSSVCSLFKLRYLRTGGFGCKNLVPHLRNLEELQTLEVVNERDYLELDARMLPSTLSHLIIPVGVRLVGRLGQMRGLRTLCQLSIDLQDVEKIEDMGKLTNLRELKLSRSIYSVGDTCDVLISSLCKLCSLRSLTIWGSLDNDVLACWSPPPRHLRRLHALGCPFSTVPADWITQLSNLSSLEIQVRSLSNDGADVLGRLNLMVHLRLHVGKHQEGIVVVRSAAFRNLREFWFRCPSPCLTFEAGTMPRIRSLTIECYAQGARQADSVLDGIEHLGSLEEFKVHIYVREDFLPMGVCSLPSEKPHMEHRRWDGKSLEDALKETISKNPRSFRVVIETV